MIINSNFKPAWWLKNCHAQTIFSTIAKPRKALIDKHERLELPDGDFLDLAWATGNLSAKAPLVVLLHGLGGSVNSTYVAGLLNSFNAAGLRGVLMHFRGASGPNRLPRSYHSGDTLDLLYFLNLISKREPDTKKAVVGISLGANVLLKCLGELGSQSLIQAAVAVSTPFQLELVVSKVNRGFSKVYQVYLLKALQSAFLKKLDLINTHIHITKAELLSLKTLRDFDERITAPLHGFKSAQNYYQLSSSKQYLRDIKTPTLILHALDDPFMVPEIIPKANELSSFINFELSESGGHVGFIAGISPSKPVYWLEKRIPEFLKQIL